MPAPARIPPDLVIYIVAHADDWQLFMNPETYYDLTDAEKKVVFIVTTAGDAGMGRAFWRAREEGMKSSVVYCLAPNQPLEYIEGYKKIENRSIYFWSVNHTVSYFLRLPDGGVTGEGFEENGYNNLRKLEDGTIRSLSSLDGSFTLSSLECFGKLLSDIISSEAKTSSGKISIKFPDPDELNNPFDHSDHQSTGRVILALKNLPACTKVLFKGYGNSCTKFLSPEDIFWKSGMFAAYERTVFEKSGYSTLAEDPFLYQKWIVSRPEFYVKEDGQ